MCFQQVLFLIAISDIKDVKTKIFFYFTFICTSRIKTDVPLTELHVPSLKRPVYTALILILSNSPLIIRLLFTSIHIFFSPCSNLYIIETLYKKSSKGKNLSSSRHITYSIMSMKRSSEKLVTKYFCSSSKRNVFTYF